MIDLRMTYDDQGTNCFVSSAREEGEKLTGHVIPTNRLRVGGGLWVVSLCHHRVPVLMRGCTSVEPTVVSRGRST